MSALHRQRHRFFTDRDLGRMIPDALRAAGAIVEVHDDVFPDPRTADETWIRYSAASDLVALTRNKYIRYTPHELTCVMASGARLLVLSGSRVSHRLWAELLADNLDRVLRFIDRNHRPYIAKVGRRGQLLEVRPWVWRTPNTR